MNEATLVRVYRDSIDELYGYVAARCGDDRSLAEDVTQEVWLRAVETWREQGLPDHPLAWLKTVARNLIINYYRRKPTLSLDELAVEPSSDPGAIGDGIPWDAPDHAALVTWGLSRLRPAQARLLESFHIEGFAVAEIATKTGLSERAVEGRLRRARIKLRKHLEKAVGT